MAKVRVGTKDQQERELADWSGEGQPLYIDGEHQLLWVWLPRGVEGDYVGFDDSGRVLEFRISSTTRGLIPISIPAERPKEMKTAPSELFLVPVLSPEELARIKAIETKAPSLPDYLRTEEPDIAVLRRVAWFAGQCWDERHQMDIQKWSDGVR